MKIQVIIADPAGNRTAIVRAGVPKAERAAVTKALMDKKDLGIEQVGFESRPLYSGSAGRLEMSGGEFCGNAARSYGYLLCTERGTDHCKIEISGTRDQLEVICDTDRGTSAAQMPMPERLMMVGEDADHLYPLVIFHGIAHLVCRNMAPDEAFADRMIEKFGANYSAFGIMFAQEPGEMPGDGISGAADAAVTPVVWVQEAGTLFWEKACGSGSLALAYVMALKEKDGFYAYTFRQPGGEIIVRIAKRQGRYAGTVGGALTLEEPFEMDHK